MSITYSTEPAKPYGDRFVAPGTDMMPDAPFVPVYARRGKARGGQGKVRTWMILTPVAVLVLGGIGAMLVLNGGDAASTPRVEPVETAPVPLIAPIEAAAVPLTTASRPEPLVATRPVAGDAAPLRRVAPVPVRREAARTPAPTPVADTRVEVPAAAAPVGPQPYASAVASNAPSTTTLNTAPAVPAPATSVPSPPVVIAEPIG